MQSFQGYFCLNGTLHMQIFFSKQEIPEFKDFPKEIILVLLLQLPPISECLKIILNGRMPFEREENVTETNLPDVASPKELGIIYSNFRKMFAADAYLFN